MADPHMIGNECWSFVVHLTYSADVENSPQKSYIVTFVSADAIEQEAHKVILAVSSWLWLWLGKSCLVSDFLMSALLAGRPTMPRLLTPSMCLYMYSSFLCPADSVINAQQQCRHIGAYDSCTCPFSIPWTHCHHLGQQRHIVDIKIFFSLSAFGEVEKKK